MAVRSLSFPQILSSLVALLVLSANAQMLRAQSSKQDNNPDETKPYQRSKRYEDFLNTGEIAALIDDAIELAARDIERDLHVSLALTRDARGQLIERAGRAYAWVPEGDEKPISPSDDLKLATQNFVAGWMAWELTRNRQRTGSLSAKELTDYIREMGNVRYDKLVPVDAITSLIAELLPKAIERAQARTQDGNFATFEIDPRFAAQLASYIGRFRPTVPMGEGETRQKVNDKLRQGIGVFLENFLRFEAERSITVPVKVMFSDVAQYRQSFRGCGQMPCDGIPPCCSDCDPCPPNRRGLDTFAPTFVPGIT